MDATATSSAASSATATTATAPKRTRVMLGLPHNGMLHTSFVLSLIESVNVLVQSGRYEVVVSPGKSSHVAFSRLQSFGCDVLRGKGQHPFNDSAYDVFVSIDSDIVFGAQQLIELIESTRIHPVVSGYYMMADGKHFAVVRDWNREYFAEKGTFPFLDVADMEPHMIAFQKEMDERRAAVESGSAAGELPPLSAPTFQKVSYTGMGFFACRKEVLNALQYPYFHRELQRIRTKDGRELVDMCSEDVALCKNIEDAGFDLMLNNRLRVGHEKTVIL